jgi:hypothetical protein
VIAVMKKPVTVVCIAMGRIGGANHVLSNPTSTIPFIALNVGRMVHLKTLSFLTWAMFLSLAILAQKVTVARRRTFLEIEE